MNTHGPSNEGNVDSLGRNVPSRWPPDEPEQPESSISSSPCVHDQHDKVTEPRKDNTANTQSSISLARWLASLRDSRSYNPFTAKRPIRRSLDAASTRQRRERSAWLPQPTLT